MNKNPFTDEVPETAAEIGFDNPTYFLPSMSEIVSQGYKGIVMAGSLFGLTLPLLTFIFQLTVLTANGQLNWPRLDDLGSAIGWLLFAMLVGFLVGGFLSMFFGIIASTLVELFNSSLGHIWEATTTSSIAGGMTGYFSLATFISFWTIDFDVRMVPFLLATCLAMIFGQIGALLKTVEALKDYHKRSPLPAKRLCRESAVGGSPITTKKMLIVTAWFSLGFAIVSAIYSKWPNLALCIAAYPLFQTIIYFAIHIIMTPWMKRSISKIVETDG